MNSYVASFLFRKFSQLKSAAGGASGFKKRPLVHEIARKITKGKRNSSSFIQTVGLESLDARADDCIYQVKGNLGRLNFWDNFS